MKYFFICFLLFSISSCRVKNDFRYPLIIENLSGESIFYCMADESSVVMYNDTVLPMNQSDLRLKLITDKDTVGNPIRWVERISYLPLDTLSVYFFHPDTLATYPWDTIRTQYNILKRYDLSIEDLNTLNYKIPYPPTPGMEQMRQYP